MKKNLLIIISALFLIPLTIQAKGKWKPILEIEPNNIIYALNFLDSNHISFNYEKTIIDSIVVAETMFFFTSDGGRNWNKRLFDTVQKNSFRSVVNLGNSHWIDTNSILFCGDLFSLYKTTDLGVTWDSVTFDVDTIAKFDRRSVISLSMPDNKYGIINLGYHGLYVSNDTGKVWERIFCPMEIEDDTLTFIEGAFRFGPNIIYLNITDKLNNTSSNVSWFVKSTNSGTSWSINRMPLDSSHFKLHFINDSTGFLFGTELPKKWKPNSLLETTYYKTTNGGKDWKVVFNENLLIDPVFSFSNYDEQHLIVSVGSGFIWSEDGGESWRYEDTSNIDGKHHWGFHFVIYTGKNNLWASTIANTSLYKFFPEGSSAVESEPLIASKIYPNPVVSNNIINMEFENEISVKEIYLSIIDASGKNVYSTVLKINSRSAFAELPSYLVSGTYHAVISSSGFPISVSRFVIAR